MAETVTRKQLQVLSQSFLFHEIDEISVERIITDQSCVVETFSKGMVVLEPAHFPRAIGIVLSGILRVDRSSEEYRITGRSSLLPGDAFGAEAIFCSHPLPRLVADTVAEVLLIPEARLRWAMRRDFAMTENYLQYLSEQIRQMDRRISNLTAGSVIRKIAGFLRSCPEGIYRGSMTGLAGQMSVSRASLYRGLDVLEEAGLIKRAGKTIRVLDPEGLNM